MIVIDKALQARVDANDPIRLGIVGAGFIGRAIVHQIVKSVPGIRVAAIANRTPETAKDVYTSAGLPHVRHVDTAAQLERAVSDNVPAYTGDYKALCQAGNIEAILEVTGTVEYGSHVFMEAINNGKHFIAMNAELDGTLGPILKYYADKAGVVYTQADGDQPGVTMNLYRFVKFMGFKPLLCGSIKGMLDPYRTPETQEGFAKKWGQRPHMVTGAADGTKMSLEQATVANATGMRVLKRGMHGYAYPGFIDEPDYMNKYTVEELEAVGGAVDYALGSKPSPGVFVFGTMADSFQRHYLNLYKAGAGPLYCFYVPFHLLQFEAPGTVARAVLFKDASVAALNGPVVEVISIAKKDLKVGDMLDGIGGFTLYGQCENTNVVRAERLLPVGLTEGCRMVRDVARDQPITFADIELPASRLCDRLYEEQTTRFAVR